MIVAGVMSGTSADGVDVALVNISAGRSSRDGLKLKLIGHLERPYPAPVRRAVLSTMNATQAGVSDLARLNFLLAEIYAQAVIAAQKKFRAKVDLVGCHGQTIYHQGQPSAFLGSAKKISATWQIGEGSVIAARIGAPVVSDFRPADMAAGGKGAPLVPFFDYIMYQDRRKGRIAQNIGGIANLTAIPAGAKPKDLVAFDTGPGNMVIDAVAEALLGKPFDRNGSIAASGTASERVVRAILRRRFFLSKPPKTAGREEFGREFVHDFLQLCGPMSPQDALATATSLTAHSIALALERFVLNQPDGNFQEMIVAGGGTRNSTVMAMLAQQLNPLGLKLRTSDEFGIPSQAKEALAFAVLAYHTWRRKPSNVPSATGASRPAILGKISYP